MKYLALLLIFGFGLSSFGQTIKSLGYNTTNGQVVASTGTNVLKFTNDITLDAGEGGMQFHITGSGVAIFSGAAGEDIFTIPNDDPPIFAGGYWSDPTIRQSFGFSTNLNALWTATNASNARSAVGLDATNSVTFQRITVDPSASAAAFRFGTNLTGLWSGADDNYRSFFVRAGGSSLVSFETNRILFFTNVVFDGGSSGVVAAQTRTNLGLGGGITATNTFVSYNGTNYTTNTVTISNGIITGWTQ